MAAILKSRFFRVFIPFLLRSWGSIPYEFLPLSAFTKTSWMFFDEVSVIWWKCLLGPNLKFAFTIAEGMLASSLTSVKAHCMLRKKFITTPFDVPWTCCWVMDGANSLIIGMLQSFTTWKKVKCFMYVISKEESNWKWVEINGWLVLPYVTR